MKKILIASILGLAASVATSYGQGSIGSIIFNTYLSSAYDPAVWSTAANAAPLGFAGQQVSQAGFTADLLYSDSAGSGDTYLPGNTGALTANQGITLTTINGGYGSGWIVGPTVSFAYTAGSAVTFTIELFQGSSYAAAVAGTGLGYGSLTWTEQASAIATGESPSGYFKSLTGPGSYTPGVSDLVVQENVVPEPATMAIVGLGAAGLLALRRRKA